METPQRSAVPFDSLEPGAVSLELYEQIVRSAQEGVIVYGRDLSYLLWNPYMERLTGVCAADVLGRQPLEAFPFLKDTGIIQGLREVLAGAPESVDDFPFTVPSTGRSGWVSVTYSPLFDGKGEITGAIGMVRDISERRRIERELRQSRANMEALLESTNDMIWSVDLDFRLLTFNSTLADHLRRGYGTEITVGMAERDIVPERRASRWMAYYAQCIREGPFVAEYDLDDGRTFSWTFNRIIQDGATVGVSVFGQDISVQRRAEEAIRESAERLELATSSGSLGVWEMNLGDGTQIWNGRMFELYGLAPRAPHPDHAYWCAHIVHPDDLEATDAGIREALAGLRPYDFEFRAVRPDGEVRHIKSNGLVLRDEKGAPLKVIGVNRDRTREVAAEAERRRLLLDLQHADKMESLGSLAGGVAHDINNVLAAIMGMASLLREAAPDPPAQAKALDTITLACTRGRDVVRSLLNFSRKDLESVAQVDLNIIAKEMVLLLAHSTLSRVQLVTEFQEPLGLIQGDGGALSHALINLCVNAVDAMPDGGRLVLRSRNLDPQWVQMEVEDNGCGMTREVHEKAVNPFFTTKPQGKGTGLGLSMVYSTVKAHGGRLEIESRPGQGTCVRMKFPAGAPERRDSEPARETAPQADLRSLQVLLVDDDEMIRIATLALLDALGCAATAFCSGEEALAHLAAGARPHVIILDLNMPGLGGAGTLPRLRALCPAVPVLLATGRVDQAAQDLAEGDPRVTLLPKPFGLGQLRRTLGAIARDPLRSSSRS